LKIGLFTVPENTASLYIMCVDLQVVLEKMGHEVKIVTTKTDAGVFRAELLLNFSPIDFVIVQKAAGRWWYCGQLVNVFSMSCEAYTQAMMAGFMATALETCMVCISPANYQDVIGRAKALFNPSTVRQLQSNLYHINYGVQDQFSFTKKQDLDRFIAPLTRVAEDKRFADHQVATRQTMALFHMKGMQPRTDLFLTINLKLSKLNDLSIDGYDAHPLILDRGKFAQTMNQYAFALCTCHFESFGLYYIELMLSGVIVIFLRYPWVHKLLPNYKYVVDSIEDLSSLALHLRMHYDEAFVYMEKEVIPFIRENYMIQQFADKLMNTVPTMKKGIGPRYTITL
jgi:hypothetical protein